MLLNRKRGIFCVRGEVATGGWDHPERGGVASESQGLFVDPVCEFLGAAGGRKKRVAVLRAG